SKLGTNTMTTQQSAQYNQQLQEQSYMQYYNEDNANLGINQQQQQQQQQQDDLEQDQKQQRNQHFGTLTKPSKKKATQYQSVAVPNSTLATLGKKLMLQTGFTIAFMVVSFAASLVATILKNWFVVNVPGYNAYYGIFEARTNCPTTVSPISLGNNNGGCQTGGYTCLDSPLCVTFKSFQAMTMLACISTGLTIPTTIHFYTSITKGSYAAKSRITKVFSIGFLLVSFLSQLFSVIAFYLFTKQADETVAVVDLNTNSSSLKSGFSINSQQWEVAKNVGVQANLPNKVFGGFGVSFYVMIVGCGLSFVAVVLFHVAVVYRLGKKM
ncbi:hypothetical protein BDR26DRAFT_878994, partial [Obelidium mucronatum]